MTTPTPMPDPAPAPELVARMELSPGDTGITLLALGEVLWDFLDAAGPDVRTVAAACLCDVAHLPDSIRHLLMESPLTFKTVLALDPDSAAKFRIVGHLAAEAVTMETMDLLMQVLAYYRGIPFARRNRGASRSTDQAIAETDKGVAEFTERHKTDGSIPADSARRKFLAAKRMEIAQKLNVPIEDVIILDEEDIG